MISLFLLAALSTGDVKCEAFMVEKINTIQDNVYEVLIGGKVPAILGTKQLLFYKKPSIVFARRRGVKSFPTDNGFAGQSYQLLQECPMSEKGPNDE